MQKPGAEKVKPKAAKVSLKDNSLPLCGIGMNINAAAIFAPVGGCPIGSRWSIKGFWALKIKIL